MRAEFLTKEFRSTTRIDASGLVRGVSVITTGEAEGHKLWIDEASLETVRSVGAGFKGGVKVKMNHSHGLDRIIGSISNFRIDGAQVRGDLQLLKSHPAYSFVRELIETQPTTFGMSISFSYIPENIDGKDFVRVEDLYSVDIVERPACNPGGMFSAGTPLKGLDLVRAAFAAEAKAAEAKASKEHIVLQCGREIYGGLVDQLLSEHGEDEAISRLERRMFHEHLEIPGHTFGAFATKYERPALFGLRRTEAFQKQDQLNRLTQRQ